MKKPLALKSVSLALLIGLIGNPILANSDTQPVEPKACEYTLSPIPEEGKVILLEDNSYAESVARAGTRINVNQVYSIRIQDIGGSCVSSAKVNVTGYYYLDGGNASISDVHLTASMSYVPALWTVEIASQWATVNMTKLDYSIYYRSVVNDPYSCLVGGGYWYSGATFNIHY